MGILEQPWLAGLVGMATPANAAYLRIMHAAACERLPAGADRRGLNRLRTAMVEVDFATLVDRLRAEDWPRAQAQIRDASIALKGAGADFLVVTSNTGSSLAQQARSATGLPILDIAAVTIDAIRARRLGKAGWLGTIRADRSGLYQTAAQPAGIDVVSLPERLAVQINALILDEMIYANVTEHGLHLLHDAIGWFGEAGCDCVILGCTDFVHAADSLSAARLPVFDSTTLHARAAAWASLDGRLPGACA